MSPHRPLAAGIGLLLLGFLLAFPAIAAGLYIYIRYGHPPVATADPAFPDEAKIVHIPLNARIDRELQSPPFTATPAGLEAGAHIYAVHCAMCHGTPGQDAAFAKWMYPVSPQLWAKHGHGIVGVSDDEPGETYWKVANGIRLTGMPAFNHILSTDQMWQVALLLKSADQPLPSEISAILNSASVPSNQTPAEPTQTPLPPKHPAPPSAR